MNQTLIISIISSIIILSLIVIIVIKNQPPQVQPPQIQPPQVQPPQVQKQSVDCKMSDWSSYSDCDQMSGKQTRTRQIISQPLNGGAECGNTTETRNCAVDCKMSEWSNFGDCNKTTGMKTRTRKVLTQPLNGGSECGNTTETQNCPVNCEVGNWVTSDKCDSSGNRTKNREVTISPKNGGSSCPNLTETYADNSCFDKEICGKVVSSLGLGSQGDIQSKIYTQDANVQFWEGYGCSLNDKPVGIPTDKLCKYADDWSNNSDRNNYKKVDGSRRAKILLKCPGTLLDEGEFIGAGRTSGKFFTITVGEMMSSPSHGMDLSLEKNIGKKIRIWYGDDGYPTGWAFAKDWVYPPQFINNNITLSNLGSIDYTSALEIIDKKIGTSYGYKFLLWFGVTSADKVPSNNPREAVKWISINKPSNVGMGFGGDAGRFLGSQYFRGYITYGSGELNAPATNQYIRKFNNFYSYINSMRIKL